mmetsp:Transcript_166/g.580  ORF Transcript_166/g.580 Transcript_166/m.580 type:complete len:276 (-) Transcript_166:969-1796(-)
MRHSDIKKGGDSLIPPREIRVFVVYILCQVAGSTSFACLRLLPENNFASFFRIFLPLVTALTCGFCPPLASCSCWSTMASSVASDEAIEVMRLIEVAVLEAASLIDSLPSTAAAAFGAKGKRLGGEEKGDGWRRRSKVAVAGSTALSATICFRRARSTRRTLRLTLLVTLEEEDCESLSEGDGGSWGMSLLDDSTALSDGSMARWPSSAEVCRTFILVAASKAPGTSVATTFLSWTSSSGGGESVIMGSPRAPLSRATTSLVGGSSRGGVGPPAS